MTANPSVTVHTNYIFSGVFPKGTISEDDQRLSEELAGSFICFAATRDPNGGKGEGGLKRFQEMKIRKTWRG
jgi:hypothetical protein